MSDLSTDAQSETLLLQLGELGKLSSHRGLSSISTFLTIVIFHIQTYKRNPPGAMGNNHQRGDGELPHKPFDQDWSLLGPCRSVAGVRAIVRIKTASEMHVAYFQWL